MKIIKRQSFLALPAGTVFSKFRPCVFADLMIKGDTIIDNDFCAQPIVDALTCADGSELLDIMLTAMDTGESVALDFHCEARDGLFEDDQLFAVWEKKDVEALIARLHEALQNAYVNESKENPGIADAR